MGFGYGGGANIGDGGCFPWNNVFFPSFIIFLILILLVFGMGFWGYGGGAYEK